MSKEREVARAMILESAERIKRHYAVIHQLAEEGEDGFHEAIRNREELIEHEETLQQTLLTMQERADRL